ncbi:putative ABC transport system permease protein [Alphaproteobacteria bacterium]
MVVIWGAVELGLVFALVALGIYLTLRIIDFPDMTVNSSFTLGAAISGVLLLKGVNPIIATLASLIGGALAGSVTAYLNVKIKIQSLLAGIIVMIGLYSINLRIMNKPNLSLINTKTIFSVCDSTIFLMLCVVVVIGALLAFFLLSEIGLGIRASGQNYKMGEAYGVSKNFTITVVLGLSNALVALSGALFSQMQGFVDMNMGQGVIIIGLVSVIIGEKLVHKTDVPIMIVFCMLGAIIYKLVIALALETSSFGFKSSDVHLATALLIVAFMLGGKGNKMLR